MDVVLGTERAGWSREHRSGYYDSRALGQPVGQAHEAAVIDLGRQDAEIRPSTGEKFYGAQTDSWNPPAQTGAVARLSPLALGARVRPALARVLIREFWRSRRAPSCPPPRCSGCARCCSALAPGKNCRDPARAQAAAGGEKARDARVQPPLRPPPPWRCRRGRPAQPRRAGRAPAPAPARERPRRGGRAAAAPAAAAAASAVPRAKRKPRGGAAAAAAPAAAPTSRQIFSALSLCPYDIAYIVWQF